MKFRFQFQHVKGLTLIKNMMYKWKGHGPHNGYFVVFSPPSTTIIICHNISGGRLDQCIFIVNTGRNIDATDITLHWLENINPQVMILGHATDLTFLEPGPRLNIKTVLSMYGDFHVKDKTAVRTSYL